MGISHVVDRRLNGKNKSAVNRNRFLRRYRRHIKKAVSEAVHNRSITDMEQGETGQYSERGHSGAGLPPWHRRRPRDGAPGQQGVRGRGPPAEAAWWRRGGSGQGQASDQGEGMDEFVFQITQEEFLDFLFDDLALPYLVRKKLKDTASFQYVHAGFTTDGTPAKLNVVRSPAQGLRPAHQPGRQAQAADQGPGTADCGPGSPAGHGRSRLLQERQIEDLQEELGELRRQVKRIP